MRFESKICLGNTEIWTVVCPTSKTILLTSAVYLLYAKYCAGMRGMWELGNKSLRSLCSLVHDIGKVLYMEENVPIQEDMCYWKKYAINLKPTGIGVSKKEENKKREV